MNCTVKITIEIMIMVTMVMMVMMRMMAIMMVMTILENMLAEHEEKIYGFEVQRVH